ncbi:MAG: DUF421 domain-containing protein [Bacilli bacterium]|nr:DUF421 domain-containing protein [Bacilli bacterium]
MFLILVLISRSIIVYLFLILLTYLITRMNRKILILNKLTILLSLILSCNIVINYTQSIFVQIIPIITVFFFEEIVNIYYSEHSSVKNYFEKEPVMLVRNGKIMFRNLINNNYTVDSFFDQLRSKKIYSLENIKYVFLEDNKELLVFFNDYCKYEKSNQPIILNSKINKNLLTISDLKEKDLENMLLKEHLKLEDIYYALYQNKKLYIIKNSDLK